MSATTMKALVSFSGPDGKHAKGDEFEVTKQERVQFLKDGGYAAPVNSQAAKAINVPDAAKVTKE